MKIKINSGLSDIKPKDYYRNGCNCYCATKVISDDYKNIGDITDFFKVEYDVTPGQGNTNIKKIKKYYGYSNYNYWGTFKSVTKLPDIFEKLEENDYTVHVSNFNRDKVLMPFIDYIMIHNIKKYELLILKEKRREKLLKMNM